MPFHSPAVLAVYIKTSTVKPLAIKTLTIVTLSPSKRMGGAHWTIEEHHAWLAPGGPAHDLFETLRTRIAEEFPTWDEYVKKYYVGYRVGARRQALSIQARKSGHLVLGIRKHVDELNDPKEAMRRQTRDGRNWAGMPTMMTLAVPAILTMRWTSLSSCSRHVFMAGRSCMKLVPIWANNMCA